MRQHSGTWAYAASIPLVTAAILLCLDLSDRGVLAEFDGANGGLNSSARHLCEDHDLWSETVCPGDPSISHESVQALSVPRNALVVVGSLDLSGAPHRVAVDSVPRHSETLHSRPTDSSSAVANCYDLLLCDITPAVETRRKEMGPVSRNPASPRDSGVRPSGSSDPGAVKLSVPGAPSIRRFLVPHFEQEMTVHEIGDAILVAQTSRVSVYLDQKSCDSVQRYSVSSVESPSTRCAVEVCRRLETRLLDYVTMWIGPVVDLDGDGRLTVVITDLDRRAPASDAPVLGCVRDRDFLSYPEADLSGDILYLDHGIPEGASLDALLAHELTHAAVFSLMLTSRADLEAECRCCPPTWLNEASAHLVECSLAAGPAGFDQRIRQFHADPAACPIVASELHLPFWARRGGSRASAALFLQQFAGTPDALRSLIESNEPIDQRMETVTGRPFCEIFRTWSVGQAQMSERCSSAQFRRFPANGKGFSQRVFGTAFFCFRCEEPIANLRISSDSSAGLQITVIP